MNNLQAFTDYLYNGNEASSEAIALVRKYWKQYQVWSRYHDTIDPTVKSDD